MDYNKTLSVNEFQKDEVGDLQWFDIDECIDKIRSYNYEKISMIKKIDLMINNNVYI